MCLLLFFQIWWHLYHCCNHMFCRPHEGQHHVIGSVSVILYLSPQLSFCSGSRLAVRLVLPYTPVSTQSADLVRTNFPSHCVLHRSVSLSPGGCVLETFKFPSAHGSQLPLKWNCGGWIKKSLYRLIYLNASSSGSGRRCGLVGGSM